MKSLEPELCCSHLGECGSCTLTHPYGQQLAEKQARFAALFAPFFTGTPAVYGSPATHFRARIEYRILHAEGRLHYAMNDRHKRLFRVSNCPIVAPPIASLMPSLLLALESSEALSRKLVGVEFLSSSLGAVVVTLIYHRLLDSAWEEAARGVGLPLIGRSRNQRIVIDQESVREVLEVEGRSYHFLHTEGGFSQPNPTLNREMVRWASAQVAGRGGDLLELYCGAGNFTIPLARYFGKVLATEVAKTSIKALSTNIALNATPNITHARLHAHEVVEALSGVRAFHRLQGVDLGAFDFTTLFVDPPRAGLDEATRAFASTFPTLLYISCNPQTLRRDLEQLTQTHTVRTMALFDQFPHTHHMECGCLLEQRL